MKLVEKKSKNFGWFSQIKQMTEFWNIVFQSLEKSYFQQMSTKYNNFVYEMTVMQYWTSSKILILASQFTLPFLFFSASAPNVSFAVFFCWWKLCKTFHWSSGYQNEKLPTEKTVTKIFERLDAFICFLTAAILPFKHL